MKFCSVLLLCLASISPSVSAEVAPPPHLAPPQTPLPVATVDYEVLTLPLQTPVQRQFGYLGLVLGANPAKPGELGAVHVTVEDVVAGSSGAAAGILAGDMVTAVDTRPINTTTEMVTFIRAAPSGQKVVLHLLRKGQRIAVTVTVAAPPPLLIDNAVVIPVPNGNYVVIGKAPVPIGNNLVINDMGAIAEDGLTRINVLQGGLVAGRPNDTDIRVPVPLPPQPIGSIPGDSPIVPVLPHGAAAYVSGQVLDSANAPVVDATVTAYIAEDSSVAAVTTTLVNGAYVLRLPGSGSYILRATVRGTLIRKVLDVPAAGLQGIKLTFPIHLRLQPLGYLGVILGQPTHATPPGIGGIAVEDVAFGSAGATAGIQIDDTITTLNGTAVASPTQFSAAIQAMKPGQKIMLEVMRNGQKLEIPAALGSIRLPTVDNIELEPVRQEIRREQAEPELLDLGRVDRLRELTTF